MRRKLAVGWAIGVIAAVMVIGPLAQAAPATTQNPNDAQSRWSVIEHYCFECHNATAWAGGVAFDNPPGPTTYSARAAAPPCTSPPNQAWPL